MTRRQEGGRMVFLYAVLRVHRNGEIKEEQQEIRKRKEGIILDSSMVEHAAVNRGVVGSSPTRGGWKSP